jgi:hypothetical protein
LASDGLQPSAFDTSFEAIRVRLGTEPGTLAEFEAEFGPIQTPGLYDEPSGPDSSAG